MARIVRILVLIAMLGGFVAIGAPSRLGAEPADIAAAARSVVRIVLIGNNGSEPSLIGHGSGVAIAPNRILTNAHVVAPAQDDDTMRIGVIPSEGKTGWFARIVAVSPGNDLALIELTEPGTLPPATLYTGPVADGEDVYAVGYPGNVDLAQGFNIGDMVSPSAPVKTRGNISAGRSSKQYDTLLHTAPIGAGNSGGPLLDACGRVIGINSFGTLSQDADSEFYFAASMREVSRFLLNAHVKPLATGAPCRSLADFSRDEAALAAGEKERAFEAARVATLAADQARSEAQLEVIGARENGMAISGLALLLALATGGAGVFLLTKGRRRDTIIAAVLTVLMLGGGVAAWMTRPSLDEIGTRADARLDAANKGGKPKPLARPLAGNLVCVLDLARSRVTVSPTSDIAMSWREDGCANGRSQFANGSDGWLRVAVPSSDETVTVASFDPASGVYKAERYLLDYETMTRLRAESAKQPVLQCGAGPDGAHPTISGQLALKALLPAAPNERLVYNCSKVGSPSR
ncbi:MAG: trypsin-like peptidase domain-containing protein [Sphingomonadales bacterium]|nr:trypsin-like peptidase domain-containing protein [Sphingomonadales bacterium]